MIASLLFWLWVGLTGTVTAVVGALTFIVFNPWLDPRRRALEWVGKAWGHLVLLAAPKAQLSISGLEHLEGLGPCVLCANHQSVADIIMLLRALPPFKFVAKSRFFFIPPLGPFMWLAGYVRTGEGEEGDAQRVMAECEKWLARGSHVLLFPEGTRSPDGSVHRFHVGPFLIAQRAQVPVVPVALSGINRVIAKHSLRYRFSEHVSIEVLPSVTVTDPREAAKVTRRQVAAAVERFETSLKPRAPEQLQVQ